jgi:hypothetical protein
MLRKLRAAMGHQDSLYHLQGVIEVDDAFIGGKRSGKRGRGAAGKTPVIVACEHNDGKPGFVALQGLTTSTRKPLSNLQRLIWQSNNPVHTDALKAFNSLADSQHHVAKVTPPELASE